MNLETLDLAKTTPDRVCAAHTIGLALGLTDAPQQGIKLLERVSACRSPGAREYAEMTQEQLWQLLDTGTFNKIIMN